MDLGTVYVEIVKQYLIYIFNDPFLIFLFIVAILLYFLPAIVAFNRNHENRWAIFLLNLLMGATVIGWIVSFVWAFSNKNYQKNTYKVKYIKEKPQKTSWKDKDRLYHLDEKHCKFVQSLNKISLEKKFYFEKEIFARGTLLSIPKGHNETLFTTDTSKRKYYVDDNYFKLLLYFSGCDDKGKQEILDILERWRIEELKNYFVKAREKAGL